MNIRYQYRYITGLLKRYGFRGLVFKTIERAKSPMLAYSGNYLQYMPTEAELERQKQTPLSYSPLVSIVIPTYETPEPYLRELMDTVQAQSYSNWELCLADGSKTDAVEQVALEYAKEDARIRYQRLAKNGGISENTNGGFAMAKGDYIALMDHDDLLTKNAVYEMVRCLNDAYAPEERKLAMIYSDEDKINGDGTVHSRPHFKPDFNLEFLRHNNYFCHFLLFSAELLEKAGGLQKEYDGAQDYDFVLRCVDAGAIVRHVPKILYHWRIHEGSTAGNSEDKAYAFDNGCKAIEAHLNRCREPGRARVTTNLGVYEVEYALQGAYRITVVTERQETLEQVRKYYKEHSVGEDYRFDIDYYFTNSFGMEVIEKCAGDYILYIRKDVKVRPEGLLETFLGSCQHKRNAIVGAKLLTPKKRVLSCGLLYDGEGNLIPSCGGIPAEYKGYFLHAVIPQKVSAVEFGCVMIRKDALLQVRGMTGYRSNAGKLSTSDSVECLTSRKKSQGDSEDRMYRAADWCFALQEAGYDIIVTPKITAVDDAKIINRQMVQSKEPKTEADAGKKKTFRRIFGEKWTEKLAQPDPCYNPNLSLEPNHTYGMKE